MEERRAVVTRRDPEKVKASDLARYYRDPKKRNAAAQRYADEHREQVNGNKRRWEEKNPEKRHATVTANNALRDGRLVKGPCARAAEGTCRGRIEMHHEDYAKPLDVTWLCSGHHGETRRVAA